MTFTTLERKPIPLSNSSERQSIRVADIKIAIKKGIEVQIGSLAMADPDADCWFAVRVEYPDMTKRDGSQDYDVIITDGDNEFWRCRRDLGESKLILNHHCRFRIRRAIRDFVRKVTG